MRNTLRLWLGLAAGTLGALALSSCDPYYSGGSYGASYGGGYGGGYGSGYGYGNPGFSTSLFVSTGNPRWGYDPSCYSYYDYNRRCYYDPYLYGYYPVGYRPPVVVGVPHPHGYRSNYCPPPVRVTSVNLRNYQSRATAYRGTSHPWASQVRQQTYAPPPANRSVTRSPQSTAIPGGSYRSQGGSSGFRGNSSQPQNNNRYYQAPSRNSPVQPDGGYNRSTGGSRQPSSGLPQNYNVPVRTQGSPSVPPRDPTPYAPSRVAPRPAPTPQPAPARIERNPPAASPSSGGTPQPASPSGTRSNRSLDVRSLGKTRR